MSNVPEPAQRAARRVGRCVREPETVVGTSTACCVCACDCEGVKTNPSRAMKELERPTRLTEGDYCLKLWAF